MLIDTLKTLKFGIANPITRTILKLGMNGIYDEMFKLEYALEDFALGIKNNSLKDKTYAWFLEQILLFGCHTFNIDPKAIKEYLKDPIVQRRLTNVLSGIAKYGVTKPQILGAPFLIVWNFTNLCNLKCKHCYQYAGKFESKGA
jgi:hypothetical protein